jgi:hypothetical protein
MMPIEPKPGGNRAKAAIRAWPKPKGWNRATAKMSMRTAASAVKDALAQHRWPRSRYRPRA